MIFVDIKPKKAIIKILNLIIMKELLSFIGVLAKTIIKFVMVFAQFVAATCANLIAGALVGACGGYVVEWLFGNPWALTEIPLAFWQFALIVGFLSAFFKNYVTFSFSVKK